MLHLTLLTFFLNKLCVTNVGDKKEAGVYQRLKGSMSYLEVFNSVKAKHLDFNPNPPVLGKELSCVIPV